MPDLECKAKKRKGLARKGEIYTEELTYRKGFPHLASILGGSRANLKQSKVRVADLRPESCWNDCLKEEEKEKPLSDPACHRR